MSALIPLSTRIFSLGDGTHLVVHELNYLAASDTLATDVAVQRGASLTEAGCFHLNGGTVPDVGVGAPTGGTVSITLGSNTAGTTGRILLVLRAVGNTSL
jgi:hypothetical protein